MNTPKNNARWQFWIDRGGTFTDVVAKKPDGTLATMKLLSEDPQNYRDAAVTAIRRFLQLADHEKITPDKVDCVKMGTTVATNALLERKGEKTLLITTKGFADALRIGYQHRPDIFARQIVLPERLYSAVLEVDERVGAHGEIISAINVEALRAPLTSYFNEGYRSCAVVLMHGYRYPLHETIIGDLVKEIGFTQISLSHRVSPLIKYVGRGDTTVVDAYLSPILRRYVDQVASEMPGVRLLFMQSSGGLTSAQFFQGKDAILSGPAGGIVGMARTALQGSHQQVIGFDMGGTSTDVSHFAGQFERAFDTEVAGVRMRAPMMNIHTVAAGGGSILNFDGVRLRVGPQSAGAHPGPASYRKGGPLTVTDANVMLGRINPDYFPRVFGAHANESLDRIIVVDKFTALANTINQSRHENLLPYSAEKLAEGFLRIAVGHMAGAIKKISIARGYDVTSYTLQCFGGAGGQHACAVADALGMKKIFIHPFAGVLSAYGMGLADQLILREKAIEAPLTDEGLKDTRLSLSALIQEGQMEMEKQGFNRAQLITALQIHVRYEGTDTALMINLEDEDTVATLTKRFERDYQKRFSFLMDNHPLIIEAASVEVIGQGETLTAHTHPITPYTPTPTAQVKMFVADNWQSVPLYPYPELKEGAVINGPAIIADKNATTVLDLGWQAHYTALGNLSLERTVALSERMTLGTQADPVLLEVFNHLFMNIAEQMGLRLQNTAYSVNIKERLDFSCAIFDGAGELIANAPHIPVHLGSMGESIKTVITRNPTMARGDVFVLNDPYHGGTHLPDVTVVTPVWHEHEERVIFYVASRGHHADIGGITPGSMPPFSTSLEEEGVLIDNVKLIAQGVWQEDTLRQLLNSGRYPARNPQQNMADFKAQIAANEKGVQELLTMVAHYGLDTVTAYMRFVQENAEESVRVAIQKLSQKGLPNKPFILPMDSGAQIQVSVRINPQERSATVDFTGTSLQNPSNFNAPKSITVAAVLYVFRTLVEDSIPMNAGCLRPINIIVPEGSLLNPRPGAAVVAGNVEVSSCITNALYGALNLQAASQCTMNNFTFGNDDYQYYETIAGGAGAGQLMNGQGFHGESVVQTHMTNSRMTDPEILEWRYPVRLETFALRVGSGGAGAFRGGEGAIRRLRFLIPMSASILSNARKVPSFGLAGGGAGALGRNTVERADGRVETLSHSDSTTMNENDCFVIETPGGGGFGSPH